MTGSGSFRRLAVIAAALVLIASLVTASYLMGRARQSDSMLLAITTGGGRAALDVEVLCGAKKSNFPRIGDEETVICDLGEDPQAGEVRLSWLPEGSPDRRNITIGLSGYAGKRLAIVQAILKADGVAVGEAPVGELLE